MTGASGPGAITAPAGRGTITAFSATPHQIGEEHEWKTVVAGSAHNMAIKKDGTLWGWGANRFGQVGSGAGSPQTTPLQIAGTDDWKALSCGGSHTIALKNDGTLWAWGYNSYGQLGNSISNFNRNIPTEIPPNKWMYISASGDHTVVVDC